MQPRPEANTALAICLISLFDTSHMHMEGDRYGLYSTDAAQASTARIDHVCRCHRYRHPALLLLSTSYPLRVPLECGNAHTSLIVCASQHHAHA